MSNVYLLVDRNLKAIIGVFSSMNKAIDVKTKLICKDLLEYKIMIHREILMGNHTSVDLGKLQQITYVLNKPNERCETIDIEYNDKSSSCNRYSIYIKEIDDFESKYSDNTKIVMLA
jgi:hypothetical protein